MAQIELNCVLIINWITWKRNYLTFKPRTYAKLDCLKKNCFWNLNWVLMLNLIVWKRTAYMYVLLWTPTYGRAKAGRPARTYIQQFFEDTGCSPEDLPEAMNDREKWRERVRNIRASSTTWWWWWYVWNRFGINKLISHRTKPNKPESNSSFGIFPKKLYSLTWNSPSYFINFTCFQNYSMLYSFFLYIGIESHY